MSSPDKTIRQKSVHCKKRWMTLLTHTRVFSRHGVVFMRNCIKRILQKFCQQYARQYVSNQTDPLLTLINGVWACLVTEIFPNIIQIRNNFLQEFCYCAIYTFTIYIHNKMIYIERGFPSFLLSLSQSSTVFPSVVAQKNFFPIFVCPNSFLPGCPHLRHV